MKTAIKICAVSLLCGMAISPAMAEGFYAALDAGQTAAMNSCNGVAACNDRSTIIPIAGSHRFTPMLRTEIGYATFGKADLRGSSGGWEGNAIEASADGTHRYGHMERRFGLFRIRPKITVTPVSFTGTNLAYGIGAQYDFSHGIAFHAEYERLRMIDNTSTTGQARTSLLSVGAAYRF